LKIKEVMRYLDELLKPEEFEDYCVNGIQVEGKRDVRKICLGVSASLKLFEKSAARNADMVIVHHGLFWKNTPSPFALTGVLRDRIAVLLGADISFAAYHLPLDAHPEIGHAACLAASLGLEGVERWDVGVTGLLDEPRTVASLSVKTGETVGGEPLFLDFSGGRKIRRVTIVTGGASYLAAKAGEDGAEAFILGSLSENTVREAEEQGLSLVAGGHYNTERPGVLALGDRIATDLGLDTEFIEVPNPV